MTVKIAPYVGIAVPDNYSGVSAEYWGSDKESRAIAEFYGVMKTRVMEAAGPARLRGIKCRACGNDAHVRSRGDAITAIARHKRNGRKRKQIICFECYEAECKAHRMRQFGRIEREAVRANSGGQNHGVRKVKGGNDFPCKEAKEEFYKSWEWRTARMEAIKEHGRVCQCCGNAPGMKYASGEPVRIVVDHIKPLSKHWNMRLAKSNLQVLCDECNMGKGNWDETDFRPPAAPDEWVTSDCGVDPNIILQLTDRTTGTLQ